MQKRNEIKIERRCKTVNTNQHLNKTTQDKIKRKRLFFLSPPLSPSLRKAFVVGIRLETRASHPLPNTHTRTFMFKLTATIVRTLNDNAITMTERQELNIMEHGAHVCFEKIKHMHNNNKKPNFSRDDDVDDDGFAC